jgi:predicted hotdog family 3-hydroxylacyl-ACP dehydratase
MRKIQDIPLNELLPQRPPFVMIDRLLMAEGLSCVTELLVKNENVFVENGSMTAAGLVENIAQSAAAHIGYLSIDKGDAVKIGVIGAISNLSIARTPMVGETIKTSVNRLEEAFNITLIEAEVRCNDEVLANARMKIALTDIDSKE